MEICLGMMFMSPRDFWNLAPRELYAAVEGFTEFHTSQTEKPMSRDELDDLMELYPD
tara:strand:- start:2490 stop:2660 length:171 start_codon:yes stop_codon:yes gene_type:complete